jgi:hypothetical protein
MQPAHYQIWDDVLRWVEGALAEGASARPSHLMQLHQIYDGSNALAFLIGKAEGHDSPGSRLAWEAHWDLQAAILLGAGAYYKQAGALLRGPLEMALLGPYLHDHGAEHAAWVKDPQQRTPGHRCCEDYVLSKPPADAYDAKFGLRKEISACWDRLSAYVHTRGALREAIDQARENVVRFDASNFDAWQQHALWVYDILTTCALLHYASLAQFGESDEIGLVRAPKPQQSIINLRCYLDWL